MHRVLFTLAAGGEAGESKQSEPPRPFDALARTHARLVGLDQPERYHRDRYMSMM